MKNAKQILVSTKQAKMFAAEVYSDIAEYINSHQQEYEDFLHSDEAMSILGGEVYYDVQ